MSESSHNWLGRLLGALGTEPAPRPRAGLPPWRAARGVLHWELHRTGLLWGAPAPLPDAPVGAASVVRSAWAMARVNLPTDKANAVVLDALARCVGATTHEEQELADRLDVVLGPIPHERHLDRHLRVLALTLAAARAARRLAWRPGSAPSHAVLERFQEATHGSLQAAASALEVLAGWNTVGARRLMPGWPPVPLAGITVGMVVAQGLLEERLLGPQDVAVESLAHAWGLPPVRTRRLVHRVADLQRARRASDTTWEARAGRMAGWVQRAVSRNMDAVVRQIRETGELAALLAKAGAGNTLTAEEWARAREQLVDVAKVVPSLAVFALPGGALLLPLLLKVLPFDLRPSSFRDPPPSAGRPTRTTSRAGMKT